jgi:hypothetical protein
MWIYWYINNFKFSNISKRFYISLIIQLFIQINWKCPNIFRKLILEYLKNSEVFTVKKFKCFQKFKMLENVRKSENLYWL